MRSVMIINCHLQRLSALAGRRHLQEMFPETVIDRLMQKSLRLPTLSTKKDRGPVGQGSFGIVERGEWEVEGGLE